MPDIDFGRISESLNEKSDRDLRNVDTTAKADAVIDYQEPTAENSYTWYRKYKSGWVEQGGGYSNSAWGSNSNITFVIPMVLETIQVSITNVSVATANPALRNLTLNGLTSTGFSTANNVNVKAWFACGMAAN